MATFLRGTLVLPLFLFASSAYAASPGLPFTEDFSDQNLMDAAGTTANWATEEAQLIMAFKRTQYEVDFSSVTPFTFSGANATYDLVAGDVDGDGDLDLVVINQNEINQLYLNDGASDPWGSVPGVNITTDGNASHSPESRGYVSDEWNESTRTKHQLVTGQLFRRAKNVS